MAKDGKLTYREFANQLRRYEADYNHKCIHDENFKPDDSKRHLTGCIVFKESNWPGKNYSEESRTYRVSSGNKAYMPNMGGYSIYGSSLDGTDPCVRLEQCMREEGVPTGWEVDYCYIDGYCQY